jgi:mannose-6-phosphate isomerase-like protein (cupin superfamily)
MKISIENAPHYTWGRECDGWHLVNQPGLGVIRERMPPGTEEVHHFHHRARQFFWILAGRAEMLVAGETVALEPGQGVEIAPGTPHQIRNPGPVDLEFLVVSHPHSHGDRAPVP